MKDYVFNLKVDSFLYEIHIIVSEVTMLGFLFIIATFVQYYEMIFCGDFQFCYNWFSCCLRCVPKKVKGLTDNIKLSCQCFSYYCLIRPPLKIFQFAQTRPTDLGMGR